jgi:hypothetical protein
MYSTHDPELPSVDGTLPPMTDPMYSLIRGFGLYLCCRLSLLMSFLIGFYFGAHILLFYLRQHLKSIFESAQLSFEFFFFFRILKLLNQRKLENLKERWWNQNPEKKASES